MRKVIQSVTYSRRAALSAGVSATIAGCGYELLSARRKVIPFLFTIDIHDRPDLAEMLNQCLDVINGNAVKATFFMPGLYATRRNIVPVLRRMLAEGHQVGCHGLDHAEDYYVDSCATQRRNLASARKFLADATGVSVGAFRAPAFRISRDTLPLLQELNFTTDSSICSQRLPWLSSQVSNYHWLFAPRMPYHPSAKNPYARGSLKLLEIPISALGMPLMSALNAVQPWLTQGLLSVLRTEATVVAKPIVYQCHPEDFVYREQPRRPVTLKWNSFIPSAKYGIPARWALEETDGATVYKDNTEIFEDILGASAFAFETVDSYVRRTT